jgi:hypothetical protein
VTVLEGHEERLVGYLLGELAAPEQETVEESYVGDAAAFQRLLAAEEDLIDTYVAGGLSPERRLRFERHFLGTSPERRERVAFARALARWAPAAVPAGRSARPRSDWVAAAALVAVLLVGGALFVVRMRALQQELQRAESRHADAVRRGEESAQRSAGLQQRLDSLLVELDQARHAASSTVVLSVLAPGLERDSEASVLQLRPTTEWLHLRLLLMDDEHPAYELAMRKAGGEVVARAGPLPSRSTPRGKAVEAMLPAGRLEDGTYVVALRGSGDGATHPDVASYHLRLARGR